jgi:hypothetical protein
MRIEEAKQILRNEYPGKFQDAITESSQRRDNPEKKGRVKR